MFDAGIANFLQFFSLPAEILGFSLALIEIRFNKLASFMREGILASEKDFKKGFLASYIELRNNRSLKEKLAEIAFYCVFLLAVAVAYFYFDNRFIALFLLLGIVGATILPLLIGPIARFFLRGILKIVGSFAKGREIGVLGLMIASIGLFFESYQFGEAIGNPIQIEGNITFLLIALVIIALTMAIAYLALILSILQYKFDPERTWTTNARNRK